MYLLFLAAVFIPQIASAQDHTARVRELITRLGLTDEARYAVDARIYALRDARPDVHGEFWVEFMATMRTTPLLDTLAVYFAERLSETDVERLSLLAASPGGLQALRTWTSALPEATRLRASWEAEIEVRIAAELSRRGYAPP
jgi:sigma54-dependent transcription regulator